MRLLAAFLAPAPLFADDPAGFVVWKSADLKQRAAGELHYASDYQVVVVHQDRNGDAELNEFIAELLVIESGEATVVVGGRINQ